MYKYKLLTYVDRIATLPMLLKTNMVTKHFQRGIEYCNYCTREILAGEKLMNLANRELFSSPVFTDTLKIYLA